MVVAGVVGGSPSHFRMSRRLLKKVVICSDAGVRNFAGVAHKSRMVRVTRVPGPQWCGTVAHESRMVRVTSRPALRWCGRSLTNPGWRA